MDYTELKDFLERHNVKLVAVSKTKPVEALMSLYNDGQRDFGENRVQELVEKQEALPDDIKWHMIGHLQKNKVKYIAGFVHLIHSADNLKLIQKIDNEAKKNNRVIDILLQLKIASEDSKYGFDWHELLEQLDVIQSLDNIRVCGLMGMGTFTDDENITHKEFKLLKSHFDQLKESQFKDSSHFTELSMGMSGDYIIALEHGSTMVRIGSLLFGKRN